MRKLTAKQKLQLHEDLSVAKVRVLVDWGYNNEEIAKILNLPLTEVNIYIKKYDIKPILNFEELINE